MAIEFCATTSMEAKKLDTGYGNLLAIALPLSLGAFVQFLVVLTDNIFLSRVGEQAINGAGNGGMLYITAIMLGVGLSAGLQIVIARRVGEQKQKEIGSWLGAALKLSMGLAIALYLIYRVLDAFFFHLILDSPEILKVMQEFLAVRMLGLFVYVPALMFTGFYTGLARTGILTFSMGLTAGLNILLDWLLIFGNWGAPALEHEGAAWATFFAEAAGLLFLIGYTHINYGKGEFALRTTIFDRKKGQLLWLLKLSYPLMIQQVLALATWTIFYFLVEKIGSLELKVSHIVRNTYMLAFVTVMAVGYTTRTVISTLIAEKRQAELVIAIRRLIFLNISGVLLLCHGLILYPEYIAAIFFDAGADGSEALVRSFRVVFVAILVFSVTSVLLNTVEGSGRTWQAMRIELVTIVTYLLIVYQVTIVHPQPIHIVWMTDYIYFGVLGLFSLLYLWRSNWKYTAV